MRTSISERDARAVAAFLAIGWADQTAAVDVQAVLSSYGVEVDDDVAIKVDLAITKYVEGLDKHRPRMPDWWPGG